MLRALLPWGPGHPLITSGTGVLFTGRGCITYSELEETTGSASATVSVHDGANANMQVLMDYTLSAGQSTSEQWGFHWFPFEEGLYVHTESGSAKGSFTVWAEHNCRWWVIAPHIAAELEAAAVLAQMNARLGRG